MTSHLTIRCMQKRIQKVLVGGGCNFESGRILTQCKDV